MLVHDALSILYGHCVTRERHELRAECCVKSVEWCADEIGVAHRKSFDLEWFKNMF